MSVGYRIRLPAARPLQRSTSKVTGADELHIDVSLLPILPRPEMVEQLRAELARDGWVDRDGVLTLDLGGGLTARLAGGGESIVITSTTVREVIGHGSTEQEAKLAAQRLAKAQQDRAREDSTLALARSEASVRVGLEAALQRAYVAALTAKARELGHIESLHEGTAADGTIEVTIKVRV